MNNELETMSISRSKLVESFGQLRQEWEDATGTNLIVIEASVGLLFADLAVAIGLSPEERDLALGSQLCGELPTGFFLTVEEKGNR